MEPETPEKISQLEQKISRLEAQVPEILERVNQLSKRIQKAHEKRQLTLKEKFAIHDTAINLLNEFEALRVDDWDVTWSADKRKADLKRIVKSLVTLVDNALGITP